MLPLPYLVKLVTRLGAAQQNEDDLVVGSHWYILHNGHQRAYVEASDLGLTLFTFPDGFWACLKPTGQ